MRALQAACLAAAAEEAGGLVDWRGHVPASDVDVCAYFFVLHGEGRISPATPRNPNNDQSSSGQPQEAVQT